MERRRQWCSNQWRTTGNSERHWRTQGACLFSKRLERGRLVWPAAKDGKISLSPSQLSMLLEGIDWRMPQKTWRPLKTG
jgi:transposase